MTSVQQAPSAIPLPFLPQQIQLKAFTYYSILTILGMLPSDLHDDPVVDLGHLALLVGEV